MGSPEVIHLELMSDSPFRPVRMFYTVTNVAYNSAPTLLTALDGNVSRSPMLSAL